MLDMEMEKKIKIVIADDNVSVRETLTDILTEKEYLVETVKDGYELLGYLKEKSPHVIILDLMMPEKDGTEIFSGIKSIAPNVKIIIYTGFPRYEKSAYARHADKFLLKTDSPEKLLQAIESLTQP